MAIENPYSWEEIEQRAAPYLAALQLKRENPYAFHLIKVLWPHQHGRRIALVMDQMWEMRNPMGLSMPRKFEAAVRSIFNQHNPESLVFQRQKRPPRDALFYPVGGKGSGVWAVYQEQAAAWVERKLLGEI